MSIGSVVFFTLLLVTGNTMAIAVRERTGRAGGAQDGRVLGLGRAGAHPGRVGADRRPGRAHRPRPRQARSPWAATRRAGCSGRSTCRGARSASGFALAARRRASVAGLLPGGRGDEAAGRRRAAEGVRWPSRSSTTSAASLQRWTSAIVAVLGIAGTVGVFVAMLAMANGFRATLVASGLAAQRDRPAGRRRLRDGERGHARAAPGDRGRAGRRARCARAARVGGGRGDRRVPAGQHRHRRQRPGARRLAAGPGGPRQRARRRPAGSSSRGSRSSSSGATPCAPTRASASEARSGSAAAPGRWSGCSTPGAAPSTPRCGATPTCSARSTSGRRTSSSR